ncbi:hypothetical protein RF11_02709 [Thelohanellus kitauei]|uniref:Tc1-like transposase DDE domain-containing protein n=1 Tax=Thelohanellus kitauei TaxID=669202 RepID=A0A0C2IIW8_THEKT|nr:hypothetical protein RF11_02709 [Thelohanellus kitauei]
MILAMNSFNIVHCEAVSSSVNGGIFKELINQLITTLGNAEKFTFVTDNVNFHQMANFIEGTIHDIRFLAYYSPFVNPCEEVFSHFKSLVRRDTLPLRMDHLIVRMRYGCGHVTSEHLKNYIDHA